MVTCTVCGGEEFGVTDGEYFCVVCETQSQDLRVVEADDFVSGFTFTSLIPKGPKQPRKTKRTTQTRPWTCDEAFLIILTLQSKALIKLGASPVIRTVLFSLWTTYLSRIGTAFSREPQHSLEPRVLRERDKCVGNTKQPRLRSHVRRQAALKDADVDMEEEFDHDNVSEFDESFIDEGDNLSAIGDDSLEISTESLRKRPFYMRMATTLSLCQIALLYTVDLVTSADIIKWTRDGTLPYANVLDLLPDFMEMSAKDLCTFVPLKSLTSRTLRYLTGKLLYRFGGRSLPPVDVERLICRYVADLDLPAEVNGMACALYRRTSMKVIQALQYTNRALPCHEAVAMTYVITVLIMLFGCDDVTEKKISLLAKNLHSERPLFIWTDWVEHIDAKVLLSIDRSLPIKYEDIKTCDMTRFGEATKKVVTGRHCRKQRLIDRADNRGALQSSLRSLITRSESRKSRRQNTRDFLDEIQESHQMRDEMESTSNAPPNFRNSSISYITNRGRSSRSDTTSSPFQDEFNEDVAGRSQSHPNTGVAKAYETYCVQWRSGQENGIKKSVAYEWLLDVCCRLADCSVDDIEITKERLELVFFVDYNSMNSWELATNCRKRQSKVRYFC